MELLKVAEGIGRNYRGDANVNIPIMYIAAGVLYMVLSLGFYALGKWIESKLKASGAPELHLESVHGH